MNMIKNIWKGFYYLLIVVIALVAIFLVLSVFPTKSGYGTFVVLSGSMEPKIKNGDIVVAKKVESNEAPEGAIVVCTNNGESMIKQFRLDADSKKILLVSLNSYKYPPIVADSDDFRIEGVVRLILSHN